MMQILGTGSFGRVTLAKHRESETICAVKALSKAHMLKNQQVSNQGSNWRKRSIALQSWSAFRAGGGLSQAHLLKNLQMDGHLSDSHSLHIEALCFPLPICTSAHMLIGLHPQRRRQNIPAGQALLCSCPCVKWSSSRAPATPQILCTLMIQHCVTKQWMYVHRLADMSQGHLHKCTGSMQVTASGQCQVCSVKCLLGYWHAAPARLPQGRPNLLSPLFSAVHRLMAHLCCRLRT